MRQSVRRPGLAALGHGSLVTRAQAAGFAGLDGQLRRRSGDTFESLRGLGHLHARLRVESRRQFARGTGPGRARKVRPLGRTRLAPGFGRSFGGSHGLTALSGSRCALHGALGSSARALRLNCKGRCSASNARSCVGGVSQGHLGSKLARIPLFPGLRRRRAPGGSRRLRFSPVGAGELRGGRDSGALSQRIGLTLRTLRTLFIRGGGDTRRRGLHAELGGGAGDALVRLRGLRHCDLRSFFARAGRLGGRSARGSLRQLGTLLRARLFSLFGPGLGHHLFGAPIPFRVGLNLLRTIFGARGLQSQFTLGSGDELELFGRVLHIHLRRGGLRSDLLAGATALGHGNLLLCGALQPREVGLRGGGHLSLRVRTLCGFSTLLLRNLQIATAFGVGCQWAGGIGDQSHQNAIGVTAQFV
ncbi:MAG: hypothetical protein ACYTFT_15100, partial [Planctomycetota bacterium]